VKDPCSCAPHCEGWGCIFEWRREGPTPTIGKASEWLMTASPTSSLTRTDIWSKMADGDSTQMQHYPRRDFICKQQDRSDHIPIHTQSAAHYVRSRSHDHGKESSYLESSPSIPSSSSRSTPSNKRKGHL